MQLLILFFPALLLAVLADQLLVPRLPHGADVLSGCPKRPSPHLLFYLRAGGKDFSRRYPLNRLDDLLRAVPRHPLHQEMHRVFVRADFQKRDFISLTDFQADLFKLVVYFWAKPHSAILRRTDYVIEKHRNVMALINAATHSYSILSQQAAGN